MKLSSPVAKKNKEFNKFYYINVLKSLIGYDQNKN